MKKMITYLIVFVVSFFIGIANINAESLSCSSLLKNGSRGEDVKILQDMLNKKENCGLAADGIFGTRTKSCVEQYQSHHNLNVDGIVGRETCNSLNGTKSTTSNSRSSKSSSVIKSFKKTNTIKAVVVATNGANVRAGASSSSKKLGKVKLGKIVTITGEASNWYEIKGSNNVVGYIRKDLVAQNCIIVDISDQKLIVYKNGSKEWATNVITGNQNSNDTPIGSYVLSPANFARSVDLVGKDYRSHVDYWMPFITERGIGFHDAYWRKSYQYNTSTYQGNGSHGCVNMQHEAAEKLFTTITNNTNVVVRK